MHPHIPNSIALWFAASLLCEFIIHLALHIWARQKGIKLSFIKKGTFGAIEHAYIQWCKRNNRSFKWFIIMRLTSVINTLVALAAFIASVPK